MAQKDYYADELASSVVVKPEKTSVGGGISATDKKESDGWTKFNSILDNILGGSEKIGGTVDNLTKAYNEVSEIFKTNKEGTKVDIGGGSSVSSIGGISTTSIVVAVIAGIFASRILK